MKEALESEKCPLDANLEKVIPGLHMWHQENHGAIKKLDKKLVEGIGGLKSQIKDGFKVLETTMEEERARTDDRIGDLFMEMASKLKGVDVSALSEARKRKRGCLRPCCSHHQAQQ